jgi:hypothetical protein
MFDRNTTAIIGATALLASSLTGCEKSRGDAPNQGAVQSWSERNPRGYEDLGNGTFFIEGQKGDGIDNQRAQAMALANFRGDHPTLTVEKTIQLDACNYYSHMGGIVLWTAKGDQTIKKDVLEEVRRPESGK